MRGFMKLFKKKMKMINIGGRVHHSSMGGKNNLFNKDPGIPRYPDAKECSWTLTTHHAQKLTSSEPNT